MVPPILLSAAMEMQEHVDPAQQHFQHPLKHKAQIIIVSMPKLTMQTSATTDASATGNPTNAPATVTSRIRPKPKPMPRKKKLEQLGSDGNVTEIVSGCQADEGLEMAEKVKMKGKSKAVLVPEDEEEEAGLE
ncbi:hypothetical protein F4604DRAFT_1936732 [Suillus subluteus]|nr:hypothetical protein F4604DRAFT_1936732 [Suillus subluteus]